MGKPYYDAMDKIRAGEDWKRRTLEKLDAGEIPAAQARPRRRRVRTLVLAAAACALLAGTALALSPGLREALGLFTPYAAPVEGVAAADQGIEVRAVSALSDGNLARVVLEVRDLEGKRLDALTHIESLYLERPEADYGGGSWSYGGNAGFDPETGVVTYVLDFNGDGHPASGGTLEVEIGGFEPGVYRVEDAAFPMALTAGVLAAETLDPGETVLTPEQTPAALEGTDWAALSSLGFGGDGRVHVQFRFADGADPERSYLAAFVEHITYQEHYEEYYDENMAYNMTYQESIFQRDGHWYCDSSWAAGPEELADLEVGTAQGRIYTAPAVKGEWALSVPLEDVPQRVITLDETIGSITAKQAAVTTLGVSIESDPNGGAGVLSYPLAVRLADGSWVSAGDSDSAYHPNGGYAFNHWSFDAPVDPAQVTGIAVGYWMIPLDGEAGGPGYWLTELPG